jgi:hypothetical protein
MKRLIVIFTVLAFFSILLHTVFFSRKKSDVKINTPKELNFEKRVHLDQVGSLDTGLSITTAAGMPNAILNQMLTNTAQIITSNEAELFKVVTDVETGQYAAVLSNSQNVVMMKTNGDLIWSADVINSVNLQPRDGKKIRSLQILRSRLIADLGRSEVIIEMQTGKILGVNSD